MKKYLIPILSFFFVISVASAFQPATLFIETWDGIKKEAVYTQEQADKLFKQDYKLYQGDVFGATITTINGSDTLKNSRTTINDNFTNLNTDKLETSSYYATTTHANISSLPALTTVGTITTGTWSADSIAVNKGGTGTTTPTQYHVMLGDGIAGLTIASSTGTSGQSLVSNGTGAYPSWQSVGVNQAADYTWTGTHNFATTTQATSTINNLTVASTTITGVNSVDYRTASSSIASVGYANSVLEAIVSDNLKASADTERTGNQTSFTKVKEIKIRRTGTIRVKYDLRRSAASYAAHGQTYKNGSGVGTDNASTSSNYATYSDDISVVTGDLIQLYAYITDGSQAYYVRNFQIYYDLSIVPDHTVNTD